MILGSGSPTPRRWRDLGRRRRNKTELKEKQRWTMGCPISETICSPSDRNTGGVKAAGSSLCVPAPSGLLSGGEIQRQRSNLHYKLHTAEQAWQFHGTAEKTSRNLFCNLFCSHPCEGLERTQEHSCAICSVGRRCLVMQIIFPFQSDIATSPYKPIKKGLVQLISTFKAGEIQCKLKN